MSDDMERNFIVNQLHSEKSQVLIKTNIGCAMKCAESSQALRNEGNVMYGKTCNQQKMEEIFKLYTKSIAYAPLDSEELVKAYGNRSALLHRMNKFKESILDINRALEINKCDTAYKVKMLCRKVECLAVQNSPDSKRVYDEAALLLPEIVDESNNNKSVLENIKKAKTALSKINESKYSTTENVPEHIMILSKKKAEDPSTSVSLRNDKKFGRHLIATRDIKPGEIIYIEKPYVSCLNLDYSYIYCGHCFIKSWANIPCDHCNWCMFCSEECKSSAWKSYHNIECSAISHLIQHHKIEYSDHLSLRSLLMGIKESGSIANFKAQLQPLDEWIDKDQKGIYNSEIFPRNEFKSIYTLKKYKLSKKYAVSCTTILIILSKYTSLFGKCLDYNDSSEFSTNEDILFIGMVLLKLRRRSHLSTIDIYREKPYCKVLRDSKICKINKCCLKGACISPITAFVNHSCNPNTKICMTDDLKLIVFCLQPIKRNSQLFMGHGQTFFDDERSFRQTLIRLSMDFICDCQACTQNWPTLTEMYKMPKEKPFLYAKTYNQKESDLFDENKALVSPIINGCNKVQVNQTVIMHLAKAMETASECLKQPSVVICELMICLGIVFEKLYRSDSC